MKNKIMKNKRAALVYLVGMAIGLTTIIFALAAAPILRDFTRDARNSTITGETTENGTSSFVSSDGVGVTTGIEVDDTYSASEVSTQNCGFGTCSNANSWEYGFDDEDPANTQINWTFDVSSLGISGSDISSINVSGAGCWTGGSGARSCDGSDAPEFNTDGDLDIYIFDWDAGDWDAIGSTYTIDGTTGDDYQEYSEIMTTGFVDGHINSDEITIQYNITGATLGAAFDVRGVYDIINLTLNYSTTSGTGITTLGMDCNNASISDFQQAGCIATDISLFYFIGGLIFIGGAIVTAKIIFF